MTFFFTLCKKIMKLGTDVGCADLIEQGMRVLSCSLTGTSNTEGTNPPKESLESLQATTHRSKVQKPISPARSYTVLVDPEYTHDSLVRVS